MSTKKRGRPATGLKRPRLIGTRVSDQEKRKLLAAAKRSGFAELGAWLRSLAFREAGIE